MHTCKTLFVLLVDPALQTEGDVSLVGDGLFTVGVVAPIDAHEIDVLPHHR